MKKEVIPDLVSLSPFSKYQPFWLVVAHLKISSTERSPCQTDTCQNGGTCFETESGFKCLCQVGYGGKTCSGNIQLPAFFDAIYYNKLEQKITHLPYWLYLH